MFNVGGGELLVIALIALIVLGPQRLPGAARQVGKTVGELRRISSGFQNELKSAFDDAERTAPQVSPAPTTPADTPIAAAIESVSGQASPSPMDAPRAVPKRSATKKAAAKKAPAKKAAPKKAAAKKVATKKKAPAKKAPAKRR